MGRSYRADHKREKKYEDHDSRSYSNTREKRKKSRWDDETDDSERGVQAGSSKNHDGRMAKTLDGKTAGFQAAKALQEETEAYKRQETEHFNKVMFFMKLYVYIKVVIYGDIDSIS